jgi:hypothetical protein
MDPSIPQPTTFGVIIEKPSRASTPAQTPSMPEHESTSRPSVPVSPILASTTASIPNTPSAPAPSPLISHAPSPIPPRLHLASAAQVASVDPPLPSPYSISEEMSQHERASDLEAGIAYPDQYHTTTEKDFASPERFSNAATATPAEDEHHQNYITSPTKAVTNVREYPVVPSRQTSSASATTSLTAAIRTRTDEEKFADGRVRECTMWPSQDELRHRHKREKMLRSCNPLLRLSKRNRIIVSVLIALTVIGAAIGIGVGISKAYNGGVWAGNGKNIPLPVSLSFESLFLPQLY